MAPKLKKKDLKPIERSTRSMKFAKRFGWVLKLPIIKQIFHKYQWPRGHEVEEGQVLPVNVKMGEYEDTVVPKKLMDYFIEKAGTIVLIQCPCRVSNNCQNHSHDLGCVWMGKGAANLDLDNLPAGVKGRLATKEEARERVRLGIEDGLVPYMGKFRSDAKVYKVMEYEDEFMDFCFCCSCCCINAELKYGLPSSTLKNLVTTLKGVSIKTDPEKCVGCGKCFSVCIFNGLKMVDGKSVHTDNCLLCGRCETVCPEGAISIIFDENYDPDEIIDEIIQRYEKVVDISG